MSVNKPLSKMHTRVINKQRETAGKEPLFSEVSKNKFWDDASNHYNKSMEALLEVEGTLAQTLKEFIKDPAKIAAIKDQTSLANNIKVLTKDIAEHVARLNNIHVRHNTKTGGTSTPDEYMEILNIHGEYATALEIYQANIVPILGFILEQIGAAEDFILSQQTQQTGLTDVTIISDVEVKEIKQ
jgi:hypothetical protein